MGHELSSEIYKFIGLFTVIILEIFFGVYISITISEDTMRTIFGSAIAIILVFFTLERSGIHIFEEILENSEQKDQPCIELKEE